MIKTSRYWKNGALIELIYFPPPFDDKVCFHVDHLHIVHLDPGQAVDFEEALKREAEPLPPMPMMEEVEA